jgi:hypothetical protein
MVMSFLTREATFDAAPQYAGRLTRMFLACVLVWQLRSGVALGAWWSPRITRADRPQQYWLILAAQGAILLLFLLTGRSWHVR